MQRKPHTIGFTLVELIIVVSIIAVIAGLAFMALSGETSQARDSRRVSDLKTFEDAIATANGKNKNIDYTKDNIGNDALGNARNLSPTDSKTKNLGTSSGVLQSIRGSYLLPMQMGIFDSDVLPVVPTDPKGSPYYATFLSNTSYALLATLENPDTKKPSALVKGSFKIGTILDVTTKVVGVNDTIISVSHADRFVRGDIITIDTELMVVLGVDTSKVSIAVVRGFVLSGGTNGILNSSKKVHSDFTGIKLKYPATGSASLACLGTQAQSSSIIADSASDNSALSLSAIPSGFTLPAIPTPLGYSFIAGKTCNTSANAAPVINDGNTLPYKVQ